MRRVGPQDANCGNTLLISLDQLVKEGLLRSQDLPPSESVTCPPSTLSLV